MRNYRYGKFRVKDYCISWFAIALLLLYAIASVIFNVSLVFSIVSMAYAIVWLCVILSPHREQFTLSNDVITTFHGKKIHKIILPSELVLVVSYVDICPPFAVHTAIGNRTHILKDKYAISILRKMSLDTVLEGVHRGYVQKYTTSSIRNVFDGDRHLYSCVCNETLIKELITGRECLLIIPESLRNEISIDISAVDVFVDVGY